MTRRLSSILILLLVAGLVAALPAAAQDVQVDVIDFEYLPPEIRVEAGSTVTWTNHDPFAHTATAYDGSFSVGMQFGQSGSHTFDEEGSFPYFCKLHPEMEGVVHVGEEEMVFPEPTFERLEATDNVAAAIAFSQTAYEDGDATFALLGRDDLFADSLSSGGVQGRMGAPLLLTPSNSLDGRVRSELERLGVRTVIMLGGPNALSEGVERAVRDAGFGVRRVFGPNRYSTAVAVAERFFPRADSVVLARGAGDADATRGFADALGAGAAAAITDQPLILTSTEALAAETRSYLQDNPIDVVTIVGGTAAISEGVESEIEELGIDVMRLAGDDRTGTAAQVALMASPLGPPPLVVLVDGYSEDAWASGFPAASLQAPVLLTSRDALSAQTIQPLLSHQSFGGSVICAPNVTDTACDRAEIVANADSFGFPSWRVSVLEPGDGVEGPFSGVGEAMATPDPETLCYTVEWFALSGDPTAAHIHQHSDGAPVIDLSLELGPFGYATNCAFGEDADLVEDIIENPRDYYMNVHTEEHPGGEITGDLFAPSDLAIAEMMGEAVVPGPGDPNGIGFSFLVGTDRPDEICAYMGIFDLDPPADAAHVHEGGFDDVGDPVIPLPIPEGPPFVASCVGDLDEALVSDVLAGNDYYVNVHTEAFPEGAIRGQVVNLFGGPPPDDAEMSAAGHSEGPGDQLRELSSRHRAWTR
jgi:putative cell wall-binding protein